MINPLKGLYAFKGNFDCKCTIFALYDVFSLSEYSYTYSAGTTKRAFKRLFLMMCGYWNKKTTHVLTVSERISSVKSDPENHYNLNLFQKTYKIS